MSKVYNRTEIDGDLAVGRKVVAGGELEVKGKGRSVIEGSLKVDGFIEAKYIKENEKGLFTSVDELNKIYPNPRPGWFALVLDTAIKGNGFLYAARGGKWELTDETSSPYDFIQDSINVFASKDELQAEKTERKEVEEDIKEELDKTLKYTNIEFSHLEDDVELECWDSAHKKHYVTSIYAATTSTAGVMSAEDKRVLDKVADDIEKKQTVVQVEWVNEGNVSNMNDFVVAGVYDIKGERKRTNDNLPVLNTGGGHSFNARLTVLDSSISGDGKDDDKCITQVLSFSNRLGQGEVYIRTGKGISLDNLTWENWSTLQRNVNVDTVTSLDHLVDNGIYSGVYKKNDANIETFVMVVINNYALANKNNMPKSITQFKYSVGLGGSFAKYETRVGTGVNDWGKWEILNKDEITSIKEKAVDADSLNFQTRANVVALNYKTIEEVGDEITIPAATTESAGAMSAEDKMMLHGAEMGLVVDNIFSLISSSFVSQKYPRFANGHIVNTNSPTNTVGYYVLSGQLFKDCYSIKALLQCDGDGPAAIAFYSSESNFINGTYLGGVQHKKTTGDWFEAQIPNDAKACLIVNQKTNSNNVDPVILVLKKEKLVSKILKMDGPESYQEEHVGDIVLSSTVTTGSLKVDCNYGDIIKIVADANVTSYYLGTANYKSDILKTVKGNQTLYLIMRCRATNIHVYTPTNNSLQRTISIYKCSKKELYNYPNLVGSFFKYYTPVISNDDWLIGKQSGGSGTITSNNKRATTGFLNLKNPSIRVTVSDAENFRFYVLSIFNGHMTDHKWQTSYEATIECDSFAITLEKINGVAITADDLNVISVEFTEPIVENYAGVEEIKRLNSKVELLEKQNEFSPISSVNNVLNVTKPYYYHFKPNSFIIDGNGKKAIPSQTSYDIEFASRLGFTSIEANIHATSDGKFICMHGSAGNFGSTVLSNDGSDISSVSIGSKTLQWIKENVRFKSDYDKYKVAPLSLEEFCACCKSNGIGIFAGTNNIDAINVCVRMLGTDNVILYGAEADKRNTFKGMMFVWSDTSSKTVEDILTTARNYGLPFMYGIGPQLLSALVANNQLPELCAKMHAEGFTIASTAVYDTDEATLKAFQQGVDFSASGHQVNNFEPNYFVHSLDDTDISGTAVINDGMSNMAAGQTIICGKEEIITGKALLNIRYSGTLTFHFGSVGNRTLTSDGSEDVVLSDYFFKKSSKLVITAQTDATISNMVYKTSIC